MTTAFVVLVAPHDCVVNDRQVQAGQLVEIPEFEAAAFMSEGWYEPPEDPPPADDDDKPKKAKKEKGK